ncbi:MAG: hypothetical protein ACAI44_17035, partial [Candidatus Sericytochromatia bacterium]
MGNVHFSGQHRDVPSYVLNSPKDNVFETNNIRFHIDGKYLTDFSDKGIDRFIEKNYNDKTGFLGGLGLGWGGKDLEFKEVKAFIQAAAANAEKLQGMTFNLTDPQLGLFDDDDVKVSDIKHSFDMEYKPVQGTSAGEVSFVDATRMQYDMRTAKKAESKANDTYKSAQSTHRDLQKSLTSAVKSRDKIADQIGDNALQRLGEIDGKLQRLDTQCQELDSDIQHAKARLSQDHIPDSERRELRLALRGMEMEKKDIEKERKDLNKELHKNHGFWSFLGGGSNLEELRQANAAVAKARKAVDAHRPALDTAHDAWTEAVRRRKAVESGQSLADLDKPAKPAAETTPQAAATTPAGPTTPAADATQPAGEKQLQHILSLPAENQVEALAQIAPADRAGFLAMTDEYVMAGNAQNPLGLSPESFKSFADVAEPVAKIRNNALLSWGEEAQKAYFDRTGDAGAQEILAQLDKQLFDQQLAQQAQALKARLQNRPKPAEEPIQPRSETPVAPTQPGQTAQPAPTEGQQPAPTAQTEGQQPAPQTATQPVQPQTAPQTAPTGEEPILPGNRTNPVVSQQPAGPLTMQAFQALAPEQQLERFSDLAPADQDLIFSSQPFDVKGTILMEHASKHIDDQATRERLSKLMPPAEKQQLVNRIEEVKQAIPAGVNEHITEMNLLLGMFSQQGVKPQAPSQPEQPQTAPVESQKHQPAQPQTVQMSDTPADKTNKPNKPAKPVKPAKPHTPKPHAPKVQAAPQVKPVTPQELEWALSLAQRIQNDKYQPTPEEIARYSDIENREKAAEAAAETAVTQPSAADKAKELKGMDPFHRMDAFNSLTLEGKKEVFVKLPLQMQIECMTKLFFPQPNDADRLGLIQSLNDQTRQALIREFTAALPGARVANTQMAAGMEKTMQELGAAAPSQPAPPQAVAPVAVPEQVNQQSAPVAQPPSQPSSRLDMSAQLKQLKGVLTEKSYWGYGSVTNPQAMSQKVEEIWG